MPSSNQHRNLQSYEFLSILIISFKGIWATKICFFIRLPNLNGVNYKVKHFFVPAGIYKFSPATRLGLARCSESDASAGKGNNRQHHTQAFLARTESARKTICTHPSPRSSSPAPPPFTPPPVPKARPAGTRWGGTFSPSPSPWRSTYALG